MTPKRDAQPYSRSRRQCSTIASYTARITLVIDNFKLLFEEPVQSG